MYAALLRVLPGPVWLRVVIVVLMVAAVLTACVLWVFPLVETLVTPQEVTVGSEQ